VCIHAQEAVKETQAELEEFEKWRIMGQQVRSRVKWRQKGYSGTREFYRAVKQQPTHTCITEFIDEEGVICHEQEHLEKICHRFLAAYMNRELLIPRLRGSRQRS
jgi:hypothetical protein